METRIQKWGNSLALRIPKAFAAEADLAEGALVEMSVVEGSLIISPRRAPAWSLDELLAGITDQNRHEEVDTGGLAGREAW